MSKLNVLIVDDEEDALDAMITGLEGHGYLLLKATSRNEAVSLLKTRDIQILVTDLKLRDGSGLEILNFVQESLLKTSVVIITAHGTVETAVESIRGGAYDYIQKPFRMADLRRVLSRLSENIRLKLENEKLKRQLQVNPAGPVLVSVSERMKKAVDFAKQVATSRSTVLLMGETGTGKEVIAETIHHHSPRTGRALIKINCGAIPENLLEAELYGYERGAFTGAIKQKKGKFELADGGTIFLDEIGDLPRSMQVKLLRVLQDETIERLGGTTTIKVDVRVIAASNFDLKDAVTSGTFRQDLYYRLNVISLHLPPLRDHPEDVPVLAQHFLDKYNQVNEKRVQSISPDALKKMKRYPWPGNVRELENMIERAVVLSNEDILKPYHFPALDIMPQNMSDNAGFEVGMSLAEMEKSLISRTLQQNDFDKHKTAMMLQIGLATLYRKIKEYGLEV
jgi:DNA-binding NtrC family response regulator